MENPTPARAGSSLSRSMPPPPNPPRARSPKPKLLLILPVVVVMLLMLAAVILIIAFGLRSLFDRAAPGTSLSVIKIPPVPVSPIAVPSCRTVIGSDDVEVAVSLPISVTVGETSFPIQAVQPDPAGWHYPADGEGAAMWLCGLVVNYVVGLEPTAENGALLTGLRPGDQIVLHLSDGTGLRFRFSERREVTANEPSVFEQSGPRLTVIVEGEEDTWQVALADYAIEAEPVQPSAGPLVPPGQPVSLGDLELTVLGGRIEQGVPGLDPGTMYYLVEFTIENVGTEPVDTTGFTTRLQDGVGNTYLSSSSASILGNAGPLSGEIAPGDLVSGSAGYLVPETMAGPSVIWIFRPLPGSELQASVSLLYQEIPDEPVVAARAVVNVNDAFVDDDVLYIEASVQNVGTSALIVEQTDISLSSSDGLATLRMSAPPLPWVVDPGSSQTVELAYEKPDVSSVLLSLVGYAFEIGGLDE